MNDNGNVRGYYNILQPIPSIHTTNPIPSSHGCTFVTHTYTHGDSAAKSNNCRHSTDDSMNRIWDVEVAVAEYAVRRDHTIRDYYAAWFLLGQ